MLLASALPWVLNVCFGTARNDSAAAVYSRQLHM